MNSHSAACSYLQNCVATRLFLSLYARVFTAIMSTITKFKSTNHIQLLWSKHERSKTNMRYTATTHRLLPLLLRGRGGGDEMKDGEGWERGLSGGQTAGLFMSDEHTTHTHRQTHTLVCSFALYLLPSMLLGLFKVSQFGCLQTHEQLGFCQIYSFFYVFFWTHKCNTFNLSIAKTAVMFLQCAVHN